MPATHIDDYLDKTKKEIEIENISLLKLIESIERDCSEYLRYEPSNIYRGFTTNVDFGKKIVRSDRHPRDLDPVLHDVINDMFEEIFGYRLRQESLFGSRSYSMAESYDNGGGVALIYPIGKYHIVSSEKIADLVNLTSKTPTKIFPQEMGVMYLSNKFKHLSDDSDRELDNFIIFVRESNFQAIYLRSMGSHSPKTKNIREPIVAYIFSLLKKYIYDNYDFEDEHTVEKSELMIICDSYYYIHIKFIHK